MRPWNFKPKRFPVILENKPCDLPWGAADERPLLIGGYADEKETMLGADWEGRRQNSTSALSNFLSLRALGAIKYAEESYRGGASKALQEETSAQETHAPSNLGSNAFSTQI